MAASEVVLPTEAVPVAGEYDVVVCGGGPAGVVAAIAAGRLGWRVLLIEMAGQLGGLISNGSIGTFCDSPGGPVFDELLGRLQDLGAATLLRNPERYYPPGRWRCHPGATAALLLEMARAAGVEVLLTTVAERALVADGAVAGVIVVNKAGRSAVRARVVIDCTADADLAARAGATFVQGDPEDGRIQHCNFRWGVDGIASDGLPPPEVLEALCREAVATGAVRPPDAVFGIDRDCFPFSRETGALVLGGWEVEGVDPTDPQQTTEATVQCQLAAVQIVRFLRARVPCCADCRMRSAGIFTTRESRRIVGGYAVTGEDVLAGRKFEDGIAAAWFWTDLHDSPPGHSIPYPLEYVQANRPPRGDWYEIPWRCLLPDRPVGMIVAGRCISCDRLAQGSLRVIPTCMFLGQAAGTGAARALEQGVPPHELDGAALKAELLGDWTPPQQEV